MKIFSTIRDHGHTFTERLGQRLLCVTGGDPSYGGVWGCSASYGSKQPHCQNGLRWSSSKESSIKAEVDSSDGSAHCFPPYYWDGESNTCLKLFE